MPAAVSPRTVRAANPPPAGQAGAAALASLGSEGERREGRAPAGPLQTRGERPVCAPLGPHTGQVDVSGVRTTSGRGAAAGARGAGAPWQWGAVLRGL